MLNFRLILIHLSAILLRPAWDRTAKMTTKEVLATVTVAKATSPPISGKIRDNDLLRLRKGLTLILLDLPYNTANSNYNLWGILSFNSTCKARQIEVFAHNIWPVVYPIIPNDATSVV